MLLRFHSPLEAVKFLFSEAMTQKVSRNNHPLKLSLTDGLRHFCAVKCCELCMLNLHMKQTRHRLSFAVSHEGPEALQQREKETSHARWTCSSQQRSDTPQVPLGTFVGCGIKESARRRERPQRERDHRPHNDATPRKRQKGWESQNVAKSSSGTALYTPRCKCADEESSVGITAGSGTCGLATTALRGSLSKRRETPSGRLGPSGIIGAVSRSQTGSAPRNKKGVRTNRSTGARQRSSQQTMCRPKCSGMDEADEADSDAGVGLQYDEDIVAAAHHGDRAPTCRPNGHDAVRRTHLPTPPAPTQQKSKA